LEDIIVEPSSKDDTTNEFPPLNPNVDAFVPEGTSSRYRETLPFVPAGQNHADSPQLRYMWTSYNERHSVRYDYHNLVFTECDFPGSGKYTILNGADYWYNKSIRSDDDSFWGFYLYYFE
jgi:hypothetical protein